MNQPSFLHHLAVRFLQVSNRLLPAPALPGGANDLEYAQWEFDTSDITLGLFEERPRDVSRVLDVGCGLGGKTLRLVESTRDEVEWFALDIVDEHLRAARAFEEHRGRRARVVWTRGDAARLPFADASFDCIVTADALEHFPQPRTALSEMHRCLRPDGRLVLLFNPWFSPRGSHLADALHLPWCQAFVSREALTEATRKILERRARDSTDDREAAAFRAMAQDLVDHFENHLFPTTIADFRRWVSDEPRFDILHERRVGPGPTAKWSWFPPRFAEEWWSATYGAVLAPRPR